MAFAKLFETEVGQVLVKIDSAENEDYEYEVRIYFEPEDLGVCSVALSYEDFERAERGFCMIDAEKAASIASDLINKLKH